MGKKKVWNHFVTFNYHISCTLQSFLVFFRQLFHHLFHFSARWGLKGSLQAKRSETIEHDFKTASAS